MKIEEPHKPPTTSPEKTVEPLQEKTGFRELTTHKVNGCNEFIRIQVLDGPGAGGASHAYQLDVLPDEENHPAKRFTLFFQNGSIAESGVNGLTNEALLAVLRDRLEGFQSGVFACAENEAALRSIMTAQKTLQRRTEDRVARGVEGTHVV